MGYRCCKRSVLFLPLVILTITNSLTTSSLTVSYLYMDVYCKFPRPLRCILCYFWWLIQLHIPLISCVNRLHKTCYKETNHSTHSKKKWCQNLRKTKICSSQIKTFLCSYQCYLNVMSSEINLEPLVEIIYESWPSPCLLPRCLKVYLPWAATVLLSNC